MAARQDRTSKVGGNPPASKSLSARMTDIERSSSPLLSLSQPSREASVHEAKTHLSKLLAEVEAGGAVVITRRGKPVARLEAVEPRRRPVFGSMKGLISFDDSFFDALPDDELRLWGEI